MGRKPGVAADETRANLLEAAARIFAERGYDGASISEISSEAGLTSGAIYAHYASKAELFVATLRAYGARDLDETLVRTEGHLLEALEVVGTGVEQRARRDSSLLVSAIVAARQHPEVGKLLIEMMGEREGLLRALLREAQGAGLVASDVSPAALARLSLMIGMGARMVGVLGLDSIDGDDWQDLVRRLLGAFTVEPAAAQEV